MPKPPHLARPLLTVNTEAAREGVCNDKALVDKHVTDKAESEFGQPFPGPWEPQKDETCNDIIQLICPMLVSLPNVPNTTSLQQGDEDEKTSEYDGLASHDLGADAAWKFIATFLSDKQDEGLLNLDEYKHLFEVLDDVEAGGPLKCLECINSIVLSKCGEG